MSPHAIELPQFRGRYHDFPRRLIDIPGMDLDALVQETADLAADDIMEEMETQNAGLAPPKRRVVSPRAADFGKRYFDGRPPRELTRMELLMRDTRAL